MIERVQISQLWKPIEASDFLIVGSPKGVGFSTFIAEWAAEKMFLNDNYSILILTENRANQKAILSNIIKFHKYYHFDGVEKDGNIVFSKREKGSATGVFCYSEIDLEAIDEFYDVIHLFEFSVSEIPAQTKIFRTALVEPDEIEELIIDFIGE
jgi:hypothetical protein